MGPACRPTSFAPPRSIVVATGSRVPRELDVPGRELDGVHIAMDYLYIRNRYVASISEDGIPGPGPRSRSSPRARTWS